MTRIRVIATYLLITLQVLLFSAVFGNAETEVISPINDDRIWTAAESPYIIRDELTINARLTIEPGVVVKMEVDRAGYCGDPDTTTRIIVNGVLDAQGTAAEPIYFTSLRDDSPETGGDTNNDSTVTVPAGIFKDCIKIVRK